MIGSSAATAWLDQRRVHGVVEHTLDLHLDLLADLLRSIRDGDVESVELADTRVGVVQPDLDELQLDLGAFRNRRRRRKLLALPFREHEEVIEMRVRLRLQVEAAPRLLLQLLQARCARPDQDGRDLRGDLDAVGLVP